MTEVEKLRAEVKRLKVESKVERKLTNDYIKHLHAAEAKAKDAYRRGAEAMREAAAQNCAGEVCARQIRALPVPEDK